MKIAIAAPYPEGAAVALARWSSRNHVLGKLLMPHRGVSRELSKRLTQIGLTAAGQRLGKGPADLPELVEIMPSFEIRRLAGKIPGIGQFLRTDVEVLKQRFDSHVARQDFTDLDALVGMPGASALSFRETSGLMRVYHEVDGHPRARNEILLEHYPKHLALRESHTHEQLEILESEIEQADIVLAPSEVVSQQMMARGVPREKIVTTNYGVDLKNFTPRVTGEFLSPRKVSLIYVGQISLRKGIPFLLEAVKGLAVEVKLIGPVVEQSLIQDLPENVRYLGTAPHQRVADELSSADAFVFPTLEDACPLVILEAVGCGLPIISTDAAGSLECLEQRDYVAVPPGSALHLREVLSAVEPLAKDDRHDRARRLRQRIATADDVNDWDAWASKVFLALREKAGNFKK